MKKIYIVFYLLLSVLLAEKTLAQNTIKVFDTVLYFDGYANTVATPIPPAGVIRQRNDLYSRKLTIQELSSIGTKLNMQVVIKAACDNYDRIGNVNMALVPKGASTYNPDSVQHIEIGRYITPFMNKNVMPDTVPYNYNIDNVAHLLHETSITDNYDIWIELQLFGVPYAANTEISGCSGRSDVFYGSLTFITNDPTPAENTNILLPLIFQKSMNNYQVGATDTLGKTTLTVNFNVPSDLTDAALFLITSNHGANANGEEYNRRNHFVYFDNMLKLEYKPGSTTCEPLRKYNTQGNGIYGNSPMTNAEWQSFSNWCPGDTIPIRKILLGAVSAGNHSFVIRVPDAVFSAGQGNIPVSLYLHGKTSGTLTLNTISNASKEMMVYPNPANDVITIESIGKATIKSISIVNNMGMNVYKIDVADSFKETVNLSMLASGVYFLYTKTNTGINVQKLVLVK